jgi:hypothetical protein
MPPIRRRKPLKLSGAAAVSAPTGDRPHRGTASPPHLMA